MTPTASVYSPASTSASLNTLGGKNDAGDGTATVTTLQISTGSTGVLPAITTTATALAQMVNEAAPGAYQGRTLLAVLALALAVPML